MWSECSLLGEMLLVVVSTAERFLMTQLRMTGWEMGSASL